MSEEKPLESDPPSFFRNTDYPGIDCQPNRSDIPTYSNNVSMGIPKTAQSHCCCDGTLRFEKDALIFSREGIALGLILRPMYQYNPKSNGTWNRLPADIEHGQKKDMCYYDGHGWKYLGTYERLGDPFLLSPANNKKLGSQRVEAIAKQTVLFRDLVSSSQMRMVENMYGEGLLQIEMIGIRCVAYDQEFAKSLFKNRKDLPKSVVKDATSTTKKRKRVETGADHGRSKKKPSESGRRES
ncbi:hypothetical protein K503DRAFT_3815 [Rhizopogon vinicolor AM-OR11-026]|uniref:Uncharacterized protein n=1 Tax=Rhizopogon vinicolor AM-OR11-026 TaxID=1314800 RepID=A0A1B7NIP1_9AGAM|nr:hypothetical protein K503DRAFT_3815 [Rhizopogon vinicolor AM-OR11-026]